MSNCVTLLMAMKPKSCVARHCLTNSSWAALFSSTEMLSWISITEVSLPSPAAPIAVGAPMDVEAVAALPAPERLQARVGIATGLVVVGDLAGASPEHEVVGEAPNLAARLQALAAPDS